MRDATDSQTASRVSVQMMKAQLDDPKNQAQIKAAQEKLKVVKAVAEKVQSTTVPFDEKCSSCHDADAATAVYMKYLLASLDPQSPKPACGRVGNSSSRHIARAMYLRARIRLRDAPRDSKRPKALRSIGFAGGLPSRPLSGTKP